HLRRRRTAKIARANRQCWIDDHYRPAAGSGLKRIAFGEQFGSAVGPNYVLQSHSLILFDRLRLPHFRENTFRADMQNAGACCQRRVNNMNGPQVIDLMEMSSLLCPELRIGCQVIHTITTAHGLYNARSVPDITAHDFNTVHRKMCYWGSLTFEHANCFS